MSYKQSTNQSGSKMLSQQEPDIEMGASRYGADMYEDEKEAGYDCSFFFIIGVSFVFVIIVAAYAIYRGCFKKNQYEVECKKVMIKHYESKEQTTPKEIEDKCAELGKAGKKADVWSKTTTEEEWAKELGMKEKTLPEGTKKDGAAADAATPQGAEGGKKDDETK